jgi:hypothetical protein
VVEAGHPLARQCRDSAVFAFLAIGSIALGVYRSRSEDLALVESVAAVEFLIVVAVCCVLAYELMTRAARPMSRRDNG